MEKQFYCLHAESDEVIILPDNDHSITIGMVDVMGEVKERTLKEFKSLLHDESWVYTVYTDQELIKALNLRDGSNMVYIYTDGSGDNRTIEKGGKRNGGYGIVLLYKQHEKHISSHQFLNTTSARMEIRALLESLIQVTNKESLVTIYCDNEYVVKSIGLGWAENWERNKWVDLKSKTGKRTNADLWVEVLKEYRKFKTPPIVSWIRGHDGNYYNEIADQLADQARKSEITIDDTEKII